MSNVTWPVLPLIALKLHAAENLLSLGRPLEELETSPTTEEAVGRFKRLAEDLAPKQPYASPATSAQGAASRPPVEGHFHFVGDVYRQERERRGEEEPVAARLVAKLVAASQTAICQKCAFVSGQVHCEWNQVSHDRDRESLRTRGECLRPGVVLWSSILAELDGIFLRATSGAAMSRRDTELHTSHTQSFNENLGLALHASVVQDEVGKRCVNLCFQPEQFWLRDFLAIPYLLAHECVAHLLCGVDINAAQASRSVNFHDGWMDRVAVEALRRSAAALRTQIPYWTDEFIERAERLHDVRTSAYHRGKATAEAANWRRGVRAYELLAEALSLVAAELPELSKGPWDVDAVLFDLSCRLNASGISHRERYLFVEVLYTRFNGRDLATRARLYEVTDAGKALTAALEGFLKDQDVYALTAAIVGLTPVPFEYFVA